jgi:hypothetical protein
MRSAKAVTPSCEQFVVLIFGSFWRPFWPGNSQDELPRVAEAGLAFLDFHFGFRFLIA